MSLASGRNPVAISINCHGVVPPPRYLMRVPYMRPLLTGVAICSDCGAPWEVHRVREDEAICRCGGPLKLADAEDGPRPAWGRQGRRRRGNGEDGDDNIRDKEP